MPDTPREPSSSSNLSAPTSEARERVVELLTRHFADDRLAMEEFERRVAAVYAARTLPEMHALVADLPAPADGPATAIAEDGAAGIAAASGRIAAVLSSVERHGTMTVPRRLRVVALLGSVELDLRDAAFAPGVTVVDLTACFGSVEITVPAGVRVECEGRALLGSFETHGGDLLPEEATRVLRVTGRAVFGSVEIRGTYSRLARGEER